MIADNRINASVLPRRVGLLGVGYIAKWHAEAIAKIGGAKLVAVADVSRPRADQAAAEFRVESAYSSLDEMLAGSDLDAVHVLTPPDFHAAAAIRCLESGVAVFLEKPMAANLQECQTVAACAQRTGVRLAVNHNFLFSGVYESLRDAIRNGILGRLDAIDICWNKPLPQLNSGPFSIWMLREPQNLLVELGPHVVTPLLDLVGEPQQVSALATHPVRMPNQKSAMRNWVCSMVAGRTAIQTRLSLGMGLSEFKISVRGTHGSATADFEDNTFQIQRPTQYSIDFDRFHRLRRTGSALRKQAANGLGRYVGSKLGLAAHGNAYGENIFRSIDAFYRDWDQPVDERQSAESGVQAIALCERIMAAVEPNRSVVIPDETQYEQLDEQAELIRQTDDRPPVLVLGATGFIGRALVQRLILGGQRSRLLVRRPGDVADELRHPLVELVRGDMARQDDVQAALDGVHGVYHLARGFAKTWQEYTDMDINPTQAIAKLVLASQAGRLVYTSSIDSYYAGKSSATIVEQTGLDPRIASRNLYAQSKAAIEESLQAMHRQDGLDVVITRPGIVLGRGGSPFHWGIGMWNSDSACLVWGDGNNRLPLVLVDDVADGLVRSMNTAGIAGRSFNLVADPCLTAREYLAELSRASGAKIEVIPTGVWQFYLNDMLKWGVKTVVRHPSRRLPSFQDWQSRTQRATFDCTQAKRILHWNPCSDRETMIQQGVDAAVEVTMS